MRLPTGSSLTDLGSGWMSRQEFAIAASTTPVPQRRSSAMLRNCWPTSSNSARRDPESANAVYGVVLDKRGVKLKPSTRRTARVLLLAAGQCVCQNRDLGRFLGFDSTLRDGSRMAIPAEKLSGTSKHRSLPAAHGTTSQSLQSQASSSNLAPSNHSLPRPTMICPGEYGLRLCPSAFRR